MDLGEQDAVGHEFDEGAVAGLVGESDGVADGLAEWGCQFVGDALRDGARGEAARLRVADGAADAPAEFEADLGQLRGLAGSRLAGHHDHLVLGDRPREVVAPRADGKVGVGDRRDGGDAGGHEGFGRGELVGEPFELVGSDAAQLLEPAAEPGGVPDRQTVEARAQARARRRGADRTLPQR